MTPENREGVDTAKKQETGDNKPAHSGAYLSAEYNKIKVEAKNPVETRLSELCDHFQKENDELKRELSSERFLWIVGIVLVFSGSFRAPFDIVGVFLILVIILIVGLARKFSLPYVEDVIGKGMDMVSLWLERRK